MNTTTIRQKLHNYLETAKDKEVVAMYGLVEKAIAGSGVAYTKELAAELDRRRAAYEDGSEKAVTAAESKKRIQKILKSARK